ncbi:amino acid adenylation domain-containing protein [Bradyrhizobium hipponense]|uniref:Amino acid adenylation domain-containing protein n=1 Tax=Bradyrhizobium hipponense TaxID=2605638 RepID=A0A5S4YIB8_9BRAD|nr:non-ribosomal peptide synthetase [Bradyrhizobium hipponense]TYO64150.1 amino acid adenylation domain-containing protein [Bradyrhizobium hipponense]
MSSLADRISHLPLRMLARFVRWSEMDNSLDQRLETIVPRNPSEPAPLSYAQERLWFLEQLQPGNSAYNLPVVLPYGDPLDGAVLERALNAIVARHEALRTSFVMSGGVPVQRVASHLAVPIEEIDLRGEADAEAASYRLLAEEMARPFDLQRGPLVRARLIRRRPGDALFVVNMHHIVSDGWSLGVFMRELQALYAAFLQNRPSPLEELRIQYADFAVWQREWLQGDMLAQHLGYWRDQLAGRPPLLDLPCDRPRPVMESYRGAVQMFTVGPRVTEKLRELARERQATLFMVLLAVFKALLARLSGLHDIVVGSPIANRNRAELEALIGFFVNMLALRTQVSDELSVAELIDRVREVTLGAYEHQDLPFEKLVAELHPRRSLSHSPIYQVAFVLQNTPDAGSADAAVEIAEPAWDRDPPHSVGTSKFDLTLSLAERGRILVGSCEYRTDLFGHRTIGRLLRRYLRMLEAAAADATTPLWQLPLLLPEETQPTRRAASAIEPRLIEAMAPFGGDRTALALAARAAATAMKLERRSLLAVLDDGDVSLRRLGQTAALAASADVALVDAARLATMRSSRVPSHVLVRPERLAKLTTEDVPQEAILVIVGLPCFAAALERWKERRIIGLWGTGPLPCCATLSFEAPEAVIGEALAGCAIEVLDARMRRQAVDVWGTIHVGGAMAGQPSAALGEALVSDPFAPGGWLYRTGLTGRRRADGRIELIGAEERLVALQGMRGDPQRLETLLRQHPALQEATVWVQDQGEERWLAASVVPQAGRRIGEEELLAYASERLPAGLVPRRIQVSDKLPLAFALAEPEEADKPSNAVEAVIARIWAEVLKRPQLDVNANFFDRGGNSVTSVQVISRIRETFHIDLQLHRLFEAPTIAELAKAVQAAGAGISETDDASADSAGAGEPEPLHFGRIRRAPPGPRRSRAPLSYAQERLWFLDQFQPASTVYNMLVMVPLGTLVDAKLIRRTLTEITRRHEILRTTFPSVAGLGQQIIGPVQTVALPVVDVTHLPVNEREAEAERLVIEDLQKPFDLARRPPLRARLIRAGEAGSYLSIIIHHIAFDGWSFGILTREFWAIYNAFREGGNSPLDELPVQYADFARWQRRWLSGSLLESHMSYWRRQLDNVPELLNLPTDHPRPAIETHRGGSRWFSLPQPLGDSLRALARQANTTLFCVLLAAFNVLLMRLSGQEDIVVGSPIANRTQVETEALVGFFANTMVLRNNLSGNPTFSELVTSGHRVLMEAAEHQDVPFEKIVQELHPARGLNHNPLFQVMLVLQNMPGTEESLRDYAEAWQRMEPTQPDLTTTPSVGTSKFDLTLTLIETGVGLTGGIEYSAELFEPKTIDRMIQQLRALLEHAAADPHCRIWQLQILTAAEQASLAAASRGSATANSPYATVVEWVAAQARSTPEQPAIITADRVIDYAELNHSANRLARHLAHLGVARDDHVAISMPRSPEMLIAVLAVLKAGAAYVPIDPSYPAARRAFMLSDSRASLLIRQAGASDPAGATPVFELAAGDAARLEESRRDLRIRPSPESKAYIIYTSGSTGRPKGVIMPHRAMANLIQWQNANTGCLAGTRTLQSSSLSFDVSFQEIFSTWTSGGALVLVDDAVRADPNQLLDRLRAHQVQRLFLPYVALQQLAEASRMGHGALPPLREIITAGEQLRITLAIVQLFERLGDCALRNQYGPTETHVVTEHVLAGPPRSWPPLPPIGAPIANVAVHVLDRFRQVVPIGVMGELYASGACVASGYLDRDEQTAERFLPDPWSGHEDAKMYRTGDLARRLADGSIEFHGRNDHQIKIRGYRIEPGEIELVLTDIDNVVEAAVVVVGGSADTKRLVAFIVTDPPMSETGRIRDRLVARLPEHMIPATIICIDRLPLTPSGKLDREALMRAPMAGNREDDDREAAATPLEQMLAAYWSELLGLEQVGVDDDFFRLGGHSLMATRIIARVYSELGLRVPVRSLFSAPTVRQFASTIVEQIAERIKAAQSEVLMTKLEESLLRHAS